MIGLTSSTYCMPYFVLTRQNILTAVTLLLLMLMTYLACRAGFEISSDPNYNVALSTLRNT